MHFRWVRRAGVQPRPDLALLATVLVVTGLLAAPTAGIGPGPHLGRSSFAAAERLPWPASEHALPRSDPTLSLEHSALSNISAGTVTRTIFPGYNSSLPGSFESSVAAWQIGTPAYVPSTNALWFPQRYETVTGVPVPTVAPAAVFNLSSGEFDQLVTNVSNASALAYDPDNGDIYATIPAQDSVRVIDPRTDSVVASAIPVGKTPSALGVDPSANLLFVANAGSSNVTVINTQRNAVDIAGITVGSDPLALAVDPRDNLVFVDNAGDTIVNAVSVLNISNLEGTVGSIRVLYSPVEGIAYSPTSGSVVVTDPASSYATILNTSFQTPIFSVDVGSGMLPAATSANGTEFVVGNASGGDVAILDATTGTQIGSSVAVDGNVTQLVADPQAAGVYSWASVAHVLQDLNLSTGTVQSSTPSTFPDLISESDLPTSAQLYAASSNSSLIYEINSERLFESIQPTLLPSSPLSIVSDSSNAELYVGTTDGVYVYSEPESHLIGTVASLTGECSQLELDTQDNYLWLSDNSIGVVAVNLSSLKIVFSTGIFVGGGAAQGIAVDTTDSEVFILTTSSTATVISSRTGSIIYPSVTVGTNVTSLVFDHGDDQIYAAGDNVSLLDGATVSLDGGPVSLGKGHKVLGEMYDPSRQDIYIASTGVLPGRQGVILVLDGSSASAAGNSQVLIPVGEFPDALASVSSVDTSTSGLNSIWIANAQSGTVSVISTPPQVTFLAAQPSTLDLGHTTLITVSYSGGAGVTGISYGGLPSGCSSADTESLSCRPSMPGVFSVEVVLTDSLGVQASANTTVTVLPALSLQTTFSTPTFPRIDVGVSLIGSAAATNGLAPYSYAWSMGDGSELTGSNVSHAFASPGAYAVNTEVQDGTGATVNSTTVVIVVPRPAIELSLAPGNVTDVDFPVSFTTTVSGGTGVANETWLFGDGTEGSGENVTHAWTRAGTYSVSAEFVDHLGVSANRTVEVTVHPSLTATFHSGNVSSSNPATTGVSVPFSATIAGGSPPYALVWSFGDGSQASGLVVDHIYGSGGTYTVHATLTDSVGATVETNLTVAVTSSPSSSGGITSLGSGFQSGLFLGLLLGGIIAAVVLFAVGPRKGARPPPSPVPPYVPP